MALLSRRTPGIDQDFLDAAADLGATRVNNYALYDAYYQGDHKTRLTDRAKKYLQAAGIQFAENFCEPVIDMFAERLEVLGFTAHVDNKPVEALDEWATTVWQENRADALQKTVHPVGLIKGDAFLIVDWNQAVGMPRLSFNKPETIKPVYDTDGAIEYAAKLWTARAVGSQNPERRAVQRLNLYYPDRVEKYFRLHTDKGGWERWQDPGDTGWPIPWTDSSGEPLGVAVVHFRNKPLGNVFGRSELRGVIPQQDALNKQIIDLHDILDNQAWPQRWATGVTKDNTDIEHKPGQMLHADGADAKFGQLEAADAAGVLNAIEQTISRIGRRSRTPLHLLTGGDFPSGEALRSAEAGLVAKVENAQVFFGNAWEDALKLCLRLQTVFGNAPAKVDLDRLMFETQWKNPVSRSEADDQAWVEAAQIAGASQASMLERLGLDTEEEQERKRSEQATLDEAAGRLLDQGAGDRMFAGTAVAA